MSDVRLIQIVPPAAEPIDYDEVGLTHLRVDDTNADALYLPRIVTVARLLGEKMTRRSWMPQTWQMSADAFPSMCDEYGRILLPRGPLIEVESIEYIDTDGVTHTLAADAYKVSNAGRENTMSRIAPAYGTVWPMTRCEMDAVTVTFRAGYVDGGSPETADVPVDLVHGLLLVAGELYKQRAESVNISGSSQTPALLRARDLWMPYRIYSR